MTTSGSARTAGWITLAIGAQAAAFALGTSGILLYANGVRSSQCSDQKVCSQEGVDANSRIKSLSGWNAGAWAVAAVGLGVGAYLLISNPPDSDKRTAIGVGPNGSGVGLNLRSIF